ncbi:MAG: hypothetical protein ACKOE2_08595 [Actinomycetales bacterium]
MTTVEVLVGIGMARHLPTEQAGHLALDLAPGHPSQHGALQLALRLDGSHIVAAEPRVGLLHRSTEKLFEARDYRQLMMLANRHDWLSSFASELAIALVLESSLGITPPERATWARMLLAELNRAAAILLLVGTACPGPPDALQLREASITLQEQATGNRIHPMVNRIGGLSLGPTNPWLDRLDAWLDDCRRSLPSIRQHAEAATEHLAGVAVLTRQVAIEVAASGPVARASGLRHDVRWDTPYLHYRQVGLPERNHRTATEDHCGDIPARYRELLADLDLAVDLMAASTATLRDLGDGPIDVPLPKVVRAPEGLFHGEVEGPLGSIGILLASAGDRAPHRLKLATPSFGNVQALANSLVGVHLDDLAAAVMSFFVMCADIDR